MAGELTAGGGAGDSIVTTSLTADTSKFERALDAAAGKVERVGKRIGDNFAKLANKVREATGSSSESVKKFGEAFNGGLGGGVAAGGLLGAVSALGEVGGRAIRELAVGIRRVNTEGVEMQRWTADVNDRFARMSKGMDERLGSIFDPKAKVAEIDAQISKLTARFKDLRAVGNEVAETLDNANSVFSKDGWNWWVNGDFDSTSERLKAASQAVEQNAAASNAKIKDLLEQRDKLLDAGKNDAFKAAVNQFEDNISLQFKTLRGKDTPLEQQLRAIQHQFRATDEAMAAVLGKARAFEQAQAINGFMDDLEQKMKVMDMSPLEASLASLADKFKLTGADVEAATEKIKEFEKRQREVDATKLFEAEKRAAQLAGEKIGKSPVEQRILDFAAAGMNGDQLAEMRGLLEGNAAREDAYKPKAAVPRADVMIAGGRDTANTIAAAMDAVRRGGVPGGGKQPEARVAENTAGMLKVMFDVAGNIKSLVEQQRRANTLLQEFNNKGGGDFGLAVIDA
jgi:hypothetical protein